MIAQSILIPNSSDRLIEMHSCPLHNPDQIPTISENEFFKKIAKFMTAYKPYT